MAVVLTWNPPRPSGVRMGEFSHDGDRHELTLAVCVQRTFAGKPDSAGWLKARDIWAQAQAQAVIDQIEYEKSPAGKKAAAQAEYDNFKTAILDAEQKRLELKEQYPDLTERIAGR